MIARVEEVAGAEWVAVDAVADLKVPATFGALTNAS